MQQGEDAVAAPPQLCGDAPSDEDHGGWPGAVTGVAVGFGCLLHAALSPTITPSPSEMKKREEAKKAAAHIKRCTSHQDHINAACALNGLLKPLRPWTFIGIIRGDILTSKSRVSSGTDT